MVDALDRRRGEVRREALASGREGVVEAGSVSRIRCIACTHLIPDVTVACDARLGSIDDEDLAVGGEDRVTHQSRFGEMLDNPSSRDTSRVEDHSDDLVGCGYLRREGRGTGVRVGRRTSSDEDLRRIPSVDSGRSNGGTHLGCPVVCDSERYWGQEGTCQADWSGSDQSTMRTSLRRSVIEYFYCDLRPSLRKCCERTGISLVQNRGYQMDGIAGQTTATESRQRLQGMGASEQASKRGELMV